MRGLVLVMIGLLGVGCSSHSSLSNNTETFTPLGQEARQQQITIAKDVADQVAESLRSQKISINEPVFVKSNASPELIGQFQDQLIKQLIAKGLNLVEKQDLAKITVNCQTQVIYYANQSRKIAQKELQSLQAYRPGTYTALAGSILVARRIRDSLLGTDALLALTLAADAYQTADLYGPPEVGSKPNTAEILVTTKISQNQRYLSNNTDSYFISSLDAWQFDPNAKLRQWEVRK